MMTMMIIILIIVKVKLTILNKKNNYQKNMKLFIKKNFYIEREVQNEILLTWRYLN